ncbi:serine aminopeptidase domain-containing protein [Kutzneria sp. CA-103260]|uniref:serine aminopeptidase domain-containing protein n=1 Tax=Kutzneria sp. CA-103260 TaxID=2802641 RepID=UPI001BEF8E58|nr:alpha/beta hydrolase [Kutzneria sp. CA-103260]QUQ70769.1 lipase [Kutzneria sp. CA-103260]
MRKLLVPLLATLGLLAGTVTANAAPSSGVNDFSCAPSTQHPEPVVLVHGLGANGPVNFATLAPTLAANGYCVFFLTYGTGILGPTVGGLRPMEDSAAQLDAFVDEVQAATHAAKVDIVGHSEGSTVPAYYLKFLGGAAKVTHFVGFGANYAGTSLDGLATLANLLHLGPALTGVGCAACAEYLPGSAFLTKLGAGGVAVPGPTYTNIVSKYDTVVTPYTSGVFTAPNATHIVIQDGCPVDFTGHLGQAVDPNVASLVLNALDPSSPVHCQPFFDAGA